MQHLTSVWTDNYAKSNAIHVGRTSSTSPTPSSYSALHFVLIVTVFATLRSLHCEGLLNYSIHSALYIMHIFPAGIAFSWVGILGSIE